MDSIFHYQGLVAVVWDIMAVHMLPFHHRRSLTHIRKRELRSNINHVYTILNVCINTKSAFCCVYGYITCTCTCAFMQGGVSTNGHVRVL